ncbi:MAG TPA: hypothetical protein PLC49_01995 [Caldisericia bacterium]|nr:hypothetical protein [Caldisericia bacterium]
MKSQKYLVSLISLVIFIFLGCNIGISDIPKKSLVKSNLLSKFINTQSYTINCPEDFTYVDKCGEYLMGPFNISISSAIMKESKQNDLDSISPLLKGLERKYTKDGYDCLWGRIPENINLTGFWMKNINDRKVHYLYIIPSNGRYYSLMAEVDNNDDLILADEIMSTFIIKDEDWIDPTLTADSEMAKTPLTPLNYFLAVNDVYLQDDYKSFLLPKGFKMMPGTGTLHIESGKYNINITRIQFKKATYQQYLDKLTKFYKGEKSFSRMYEIRFGENTFEALGKTTEIEFIDTPADIRDKYQYFTEANMTKLKNIGYEKPFTSLEEGVYDYVKNYLTPQKYY